MLFGLTPWELILSRSFFIDVQCLFLSLLCLFIGIIAIRKGSFKLFMVTGDHFCRCFSDKVFCRLYIDSTAVVLCLLSTEEAKTNI